MATEYNRGKFGLVIDHAQIQFINATVLISILYYVLNVVYYYIVKRN